MTDGVFSIETGELVDEGTPEEIAECIERNKQIIKEILALLEPTF